MFEIPVELHLALVGFATYLIMKGLQNHFPELEGHVAKIVSIVVAAGLSTLTELINVHVDPVFFPVMREVLLLLAAVITAHGIKES